MNPGVMEVVKLLTRNQAMLLVLGVVLACAAGADAQLKLPAYKMKDYPLGKVFANPNQQWHFARNCLRNQSTSCPELADTGKLGNVTSRESFCGDCSNQIRVVLRCIDKVKREFLFSSKASTDDVRTALDIGCSNGNFTITPSIKSVGTKLGASSWMLLSLAFVLVNILA